MVGRMGFEGSMLPVLEVGEAASVIVEGARGYRVEHTVIAKVTKTTVKTQGGQTFNRNTLKEWGAGQQSAWSRSSTPELTSREYGLHVEPIFKQRVKLERARIDFANGLYAIHETRFPSQGNPDLMRETLEQVKAQVERMEAALASVS